MKMLSPFSSAKTPTTAVGLYVTSPAVRVVILQQQEDAYLVLDSYTRKRGKDFSSSATEADAMPTSFDDGPPSEASGEDYSIAFGEESDAGGIPGGGGETNFSFDDSEDHSSPSGDPDLAPMLRDIMEAAEAQYGKNIEVAFCVGAPHVTAELLQAEESEDRPDQRSSKRLLARLNADTEGDYTLDEVAFLPAASGPGRTSDTVAVIREKDDIVTAALRFLHDKSLRSLPLVRLMEAELTLYTALVGEQLDAEGGDRTAILRVGADDTLVMFLEGNQLRYQEYLRSITTLEAADTVCSRVLLQQDEAGIEGVDRIILSTEDREDEFIGRLGEFYPDAEIIPFRQLLGIRGISIDNGDLSEYDGIAPWIPAIGVALRLLTRRGKKSLDVVNLLPRNLRRRKSAVQVAWHTIAAAVALFLVCFFFTTRYYQHQEEVAQLQEKIDAYPASLELTGDQLQARIDSLQTIYDTYSQALVRLDTVLSGSDRWSRMLARTVEHAEDLPGLWIKEWHPQQHTVKLIGYATERNRVVRLSNRLDATVDELTSATIRDYPVFQYSITAPLPAGLPQSVRYLRDERLKRVSEDHSSVPTQ